jgi:hypothetical protein
VKDEATGKQTLKMVVEQEIEKNNVENILSFASKYKVSKSSWIFGSFQKD